MPSPAYAAVNSRWQAKILQRRRIALVGTRRATDTGLRWTERVAAELARHGALVISGGADGIDSAAHRGALTGGGDTLAVLGAALDSERKNRPQHLAWLWHETLVFTEQFFEIVAHRLGPSPGVNHFRIVSNSLPDQGTQTFEMTFIMPTKEAQP